MRTETNVLTAQCMDSNEVIRIFREDGKFTLISTQGTFPIISRCLFLEDIIRIETDTDEGTIFIRRGWYTPRRYIYCIKPESYIKVKKFLLDE